MSETKSQRPLVLNVGHTKYSVVRFVARKLLGWSLTRNDNWDVLWADSTIAPHILSGMKPYQRVNHFPGMYAIARKSNLCMNLNRMRKAHAKHYNFFPKTWFLPSDKIEVRRDMLKSRTPIYIVKPEASSQGRGIFLVQDLHEIEKLDHCIIQRYIQNPLLIDGLKFDLRIYALITGCEPLRVFIHEEGLARFATEHYRRPTSFNKEDICMHLTNYAVNRRNPKFVSNKDEEEDNVGHKWSLSALFSHLRDKGVNVKSLWAKISDIIMKTLCAIQPSLAHTYKSCQPHDITNAMCFEILGFDILIDSSLTPWLLEVNHSPAFSTASPLDKRVKRQVIKDAFCILNLSSSDKRDYEVSLKADIQKRTLTNQSFEDKKRERELRRADYQTMRDMFEERIPTGYIRIHGDYQVFINTAKEIWEDITGTGNRRISLRRSSSRQSQNRSSRNIKTAENKFRKLTPLDRPPKYSFNKIT